MLVVAVVLELVALVVLLVLVVALLLLVDVRLVLVVALLLLVDVRLVLVAVVDVLVILVLVVEALVLSAPMCIAMAPRAGTVALKEPLDDTTKTVPEHAPDTLLPVMTSQ